MNQVASTCIKCHGQNGGGRAFKKATGFCRTFSRSTLTRNKLPSAVQVEGTCRKNPSWRLIGKMMKDVSGSGIWSQRHSVMKVIARSDTQLHFTSSPSAKLPSPVTTHTYIYNIRLRAMLLDDLSSAFHSKVLCNQMLFLALRG